MNDPKLIIVAGVNGCGKSTLTRSKRFRNTPVIDPDAIEKEALNNLQAGGRFIGGREAKRLRSSYFMDNKSFVIETTLAGQTIFKTIDEALSRGYFVELHYIYLLDIAVSVDRVKTRVMAGGHHIPLADIRRRFGKSRLNFELVAPLCDRTIVYDNAGFDTFQEVLLADKNHFQLISQAPDWLKEAVIRIQSSVRFQTGRVNAMWSQDFELVEI